MVADGRSHQPSADPREHCRALFAACRGADPKGPGKTTGPDTDSEIVPPDSPKVVDDVVHCLEGGEAFFDVLANDTDAQGHIDPASLVIVTEPTIGLAMIQPDFKLAYRHPDGDLTEDTFTYTVSDLEGNTSDVATVTVVIDKRDNLPPVAEDDAVLVSRGGERNVDVAANDTDDDDGIDPASVVIVDAPAYGTAVVVGDGTVDYTHDGGQGDTDSFTYTIADLYGDPSNVATVELTISDFVHMELTPADGSLVEGDDPYWANKGYQFLALQDFSITGGAWWIQLPVDGYVSLSIYDEYGQLLDRGSQGIGSGQALEEWYQSDLAFDFVAGNIYTASFYTNRAESSSFDRRNSPTYGYSVMGYVDDVTHRSSSVFGDNANEEWPDYLGNSWAPYQRLDVLP